MKRTKNTRRPSIHKTTEQAWRDLSPTKREAVLRRIGVGKDPLSKHVNIQSSAKVNYFFDLPIPAQTMLRDAYGNGRFSPTVVTRRRRSLALVMADVDRVEREIA